MPLGKIMDTDVLIMEGDRTVTKAINLMQKKNAKVVRYDK